MATTISLPVARRAYGQAQRRIQVVSATEQHTLVVLSGAMRRCLLFSVPITGNDLRDYCHGQFGWMGLEKMQMTADGQVFEPAAVGKVSLRPETSNVAFEQVTPKIVEFRRVAPDKG